MQVNHGSDDVPSGFSRGLRRFLFFTAAVCGSAVMIVEILGAKMVAPYFGMSHFVWTAQIAVTLVALACGYYAGGRLADGMRQLSLLYWAVLAAALYLTVTVVACEPVAYWCLDFSSLPLASLLASTILFFPPLALLAMTSPFLVRFITSSLEGVGSNVGRLASVSTLGSFGGTLLIGYLLVPFLPNSITMFLTAGTLVLVALGFLAASRSRGVVAVAILLALCGAFCGYETHRQWLPHYAHFQYQFRRNSNFGQLQVLDRKDGSERFYLNDYLPQISYDLKTRQSTAHFTYALAGLTRATVSNLEDVLCIGLGAGVVPMALARDGARVDVVEINPAVVSIALRFFGFQTNGICLHIDDGRHFLNRCRKQYDAIVLDAFLGDASPSHLMTTEAFGAMHRALRPGGSLVINSFGNLQPGRDFFAASLDRTLKTVFRSVSAHTSGDGGIFFAATDRPGPEFVHVPDFTEVHPRALLETRATFDHTVEIADTRGRVLTDNYNPAEFFDARNREEIRRGLAMGGRPQ